MPLHIVDGQGSGRRANVNEAFQLHVKAIMEEQAHFVCADYQRTFVANTANTADTLTVTATGGAMLYLRNDSSDYKLNISKVAISCGTAGMVFKLVKNATLGTIGANNTHTPVQLNFGATLTADVTCYNWDETGNGMTGLTGGTTIVSLVMPASAVVLPVDGSMILKRNDSIYINIKGAGEFAGFIRFYMDNF